MVSIQLANRLFKQGFYQESLDLYWLCYFKYKRNPVLRFNMYLAYKRLGRSDLAKIIIKDQKSEKLIKNGIPLVFVIPTFNRGEKLIRLISSIANQVKNSNFKVSFIVFDDGSDSVEYSNNLDIHEIVEIDFVYQTFNHGKRKYWQLVNKIFGVLKERNTELFVYLADDLELVDDFIFKAYKSWMNISSERKIALNILKDHRTKNWTGYERHLVNFEKIKVFKTQWIDMAFISDSRMLDYTLSLIPLSRWEKNPDASSGVGQQLSIRLNKDGYELYQVVETLAFHGSHESVMNREERLKNPLIVCDYGHKKSLGNKLSKSSIPIVCGVATMLGRELSLKETVASIIDQVDQLIIYQNGYSATFDFLKHPRIKVISSLDTGVDMGDAGKFYTISDHLNAIYFSIDDDLIYPSNYVERLVYELDKLNYKAIITCHGRNLVEGASSYYKQIEKSFRCLDGVKEFSQVQFGGTGVMAFHTEQVCISFKDFKLPNMADVWFALYANNKSIPIFVIPFDRGWINYSDKFDHSKTIYDDMKLKQQYINNVIAEYDYDKFKILKSKIQKLMLS
jgi:hypothetical protein